MKPLDVVDLFYETADGVIHCEQIEARRATQMERELALNVLYAAARTLNARRMAPEGKELDVCYLFVEEPPARIAEAIRAAGGRLQVREGRSDPMDTRREVQTGRLIEIVEDAFAELADETSREHGVTFDLDGLRRLQQSIAAEASSDEAQWEGAMRLGGFGGELVRRQRGWGWGLSEVGIFPFGIVFRSDGREGVANVLDRALRFLRGKEDVATLVERLLALA